MWTQVETGSAITWKYPSCILRGDDSQGEFYSIAIANNAQQADTGTKMVHLGKRTKSRIVSKGISAGRAQNTYRGLVSMHPKATDSRNYTQCDSLLIGDKCGAHTVPYIEVKNNSSRVEHEATTSKVDDDQLFYCRSRGMDEEEAVALVVNGFCNGIRHVVAAGSLPMEFAMEAQALVAMAILMLEGPGGSVRRGKRNAGNQEPARQAGRRGQGDPQGRGPDRRGGQVHAIMGPNGSGKSTLSYVLAGRDGYAVTDGAATLDGVDLLEMEPEERAAAGLFLAFQYPVEIPGVGNMTFLRTAVNAQRKARGEPEMSAGDFLKVVREKAKALKIDAEMLKRPVNVGFSGGEKKRNEILQMAMLEPRMCILDETDSGLDVDAMKLVADGVNALRDAGGRSWSSPITSACWTISAPTWCTSWPMAASCKTGGPELALEVERTAMPTSWRRWCDGGCRKPSLTR
jgi:FeS assembly ATPase SufC